MSGSVRRGFLGLLIAASLAGGATLGFAERLHFIIPAGPGGGLDATARALGNALIDSNLHDAVSYENRSGGGGGKAMAYFVANANTLDNTLLVNSAPLIVRSLQGLFPHSYRDLTPIAGLIADPGVIAVRADSPIGSWQEAVALLQDRSKRTFVGGGSVKGSLDHITLSLLAQAEGMEPRSVRYLAYDGGAKAQLALLSGEVELMVSGLGETLAAQRAGSIRILGVTNSVSTSAAIQSFVSQGVDVVFYNWRGVFAPSGMPAEDAQRLQDQLAAVSQTIAWQQQLERYGWQPMLLPGERFSNYLAQQEAMLGRVMDDLGLIRR